MRALAFLAFAAAPLGPVAVAGPVVPTQPTVSLQTEPVKLGNGFSMRVSAFDFSLSAASRALESHTWSFSLPRARVRVAPDYSGAQIASGRTLGRYGTISLRATRLSPIRRIVVCGTAAWQRRVTFVGTFRFASHSSFGSIVRRSLAGSIGNVNDSCRTGSHPDVCKRHVSFSVFGGAARVEAERWPDDTGFVRFALTESPATRPASVSHQITVIAPPASTVQVARDLASASVNAGVGAPLLRGSLRFTATTAADTKSNTCNGKGQPSRAGTITGTVSATFAGLGRQTLTATSAQVVAYR